MIAYFVSFSYSSSSASGFGSTQLNLTQPIRSLQDITLVKQCIERQGLGNVVVISFQRFETESSDGAR